MNLADLIRNRLDWVETNRRNGFEEGIKTLLTQLYPDNAHFIYELLQNAEDKGASRVQFVLTDNALDFGHNGPRLFSLQDVIDITTIGRSTRHDDPTRIGKFGVGFKAVFAYTETPEIHSGEFHFRIHDLVVPEPIGIKNSSMGEQDTHFIFPFDHPKKPPAHAVEEIERGLRALGDNTLLFLKHIRKIEYQLSDGSIGSLERLDHKAGHVEIRAGHPGGNDHVSSWLHFQNDVEIVDEDGDPKTCRIAIAYSLVEETDKNETRSSWRIVPLDHGRVSIYFPAEKETSHLHIHLHAPFASTVARDSVRDCDANRQLSDHLADLVVESLADICNKGMLTVPVLESLPINRTDFPANSMYLPIFERTMQALREKPLLPTYGGGYATADQVKIARAGELRDLLSSVQLASLCDASATLFWLPAEITQDRTRQLRDYLVNELGIEEITPDRFGRLLTHQFLEMQDDGWFGRFYEFLLKQEALWRASRSGSEPAGILRSKPILRLENGELVPPFDAAGQPNAYLPCDHNASFPVVRRRCVTNLPAASEFLKRLGLTEPDEVADVVDNILTKYREERAAAIGDAEYKSDLDAICRALKTDSQQKKSRVLDAAHKTPFVKATEAATGEVTFKKPGEVYLGTDCMRLYLSGNSDAWILCPGYFPDSASNDNQETYNALGLTAHPRRMRHTKRPCSPLSSSSRGETVENYDLDGLECFLHQFQLTTELSAKKDMSQVLWSLLGHCMDFTKHFFTGRHDYFYYTNYSERFDADFTELLRKNEWVHTKSGTFVKPRDTRCDEIHPDLEENKELCNALGVSPSWVAPLEDEQAKRLSSARVLGLDVNDLENIQFIKEHPADFEQFKAGVSGKYMTCELPDRSPSDPERRARLVALEAVDAPERVTEKRIRSTSYGLPEVKKRAGEYLRDQYTTDGKMICQVCKARPLPFKLDDGSYYFDKVEFLGELKRRHYQNYLALCPNHSAMFQHANGSRDLMQDGIVGLTGKELKVILAQEEDTIYFTQTHILDLKAVIKAEQTGTKPRP